MPPSPLIAITATTRLDAGLPRVRLNAAYVAAVERAGGVPLVVPPLARVDDAARILDVANGLLLTGGEDVEPARYGAQPHPALGATNAVRDATEIALVTLARDRAIPTLGICRGIQLINVAFGGSLVQDIPAERPGALAHDHPDRARDAIVHEIQVEPGSRVAGVMGPGPRRVNSLHHQAVDRVAEGLRATAWADDGIIEAIEAPGEGWWMLAIQWHPEDLDDTSPSDRRLFSALVARAAR
jgi:putative glutamine amidotransferase